jgi:uncharacterized membrane protein
MPDRSSSLGPVSYLVVEYPESKLTGEGLLRLVDLVNSGTIRIFDLRFITRDADGSLKAIQLQDLDLDGEFDLAVFEGVSSGLLDDGDLRDAAAVIKPGTSAGILIFENRWATDFVDALRGAGAELVAAGYIPQGDVVSALDATDH